MAYMVYMLWIKKDSIYIYFSLLQMKQVLQLHHVTALENRIHYNTFPISQITGKYRKSFNVIQKKG